MGRNGWISLHRKLQDHHLYPSNEKREFTKYEAWLDLLMEVNHKPNRIFNNNNPIDVERGQTLTSILKLSERWKWSRKKVSNFLNLLEKEHQIEQQRNTKFTLVTIVKYDVYQQSKNEIEEEEHEKEHQKNIKRTSKEHQKNTNNNDNNVNNENKEINTTTTAADKIISAMEKAFGLITPFQTEKVFAYIEQDGMEPEAVLQAIEKSGLSQKPSVNYLVGILNKWINKGIKTLEQVEQEDMQHQAQQEQRQQPKKRTQQKTKNTAKWLDPNTIKNEDVGTVDAERLKQVKERQRRLAERMELKERAK